MFKPLLLSSALLLTALPFCSSAQDPADQCLNDLAALPSFLKANDAGAKDHIAYYGQEHFDKALDKAQLEAANVESMKDCEPVLSQYLKAYRKGHLRVWYINEEDRGEVSVPDAKKADEPSINVLSEQTLQLRLPSFDPRHTEALKSLLTAQQQSLASHPFWIIDVRGNGGGSDSTYAVLLPYFMVNSYQSVGVEWWVTEENIKAQQRICDVFMPNDEACPKMLEPVVKTMRAAPLNSFVSNDPNAKPTDFNEPEKAPIQRPQRVVILVDSGCGSSCEQFLLAARQSFNVKLMGERTHGSLDYSNLRPHLLPSGQYQLMYATSRSKRIPAQPVDGIGVVPDVYVPLDKNDGVDVAKKWLEETISM
ncbi:hypothetical protein CWI84_08440 [Idiomarina tyrosinivorans]|uniref:Tail specific protease domain-containing protein n=1 Tax=Idiomarina tyrosinivorans TaxID=1445662 RepID=A0A432ZPZ4_9GAMM|nr:S41 family peptidase [Idiomarina tyrosinivorans]RUO79979.1 hypothetical protein CWI84_08440 [Idiomarina tyrosinivorans]